MEIKTSLDWAEVSIQLSTRLYALPFNSDLHKMFHNIRNMVNELSKAEVDARRIHKTHMIDGKIAEINSAIDRLEKLMLMAKLMN